MRRRAIAVACTLLVCIALACSERAPGRDGEQPAAPAEATDTGEGEAAAESDPLLAQARAQLKGGRLPEHVRAQILESQDPAHARARRILLVMDRQARGEPEPEPAEDDAADPASAPVLVPPAEDAPSPPTADDAGAAAAPADKEDPVPSEPRLAVLTRLSLAKQGKGATLTVHAADAVRMGVATQASGTVRLVVESAGALPAVLQARPSIDGVSVSDVRRGQDTVQIAVDLGEGWKVGRASSFSGGARMTFTRS